MDARRAVVVGPLFLDVVLGPFSSVPKPGQELWAEGCEFLAGGAANQARALLQVGISVDLCSYVGEDIAGHMVAELLAEEGISSVLLQKIPRQAVTASLSVGSERAMASFGSCEAPSLEGEAPAVLIGDLRALAKNRQVVQSWRREGALVIGDVGWDSTGAWDPVDLEPLDMVDVFVPNRDEALEYTRCSDVDTAIDHLSQMVPNVIVTSGADGITARGESSFSLPAFNVKTIDPTGAGDVFSAVLAWSLLEGGNLLQAASCASVAAGVSTESLGGAGAPTIAQLSRRLKDIPTALPTMFDVSQIPGL